ncbi:centromere-associated protein E [Cucumis melo var. makuwa]|uniref:Centromere-associated protein E n=1 Tax=Cucumis melo var. makuwa TaxID=1194695 RepID=A0A5A7UWK0_CUCMM|nr:centromere-associated protein E [Cucumis melo var. makuwa]
MLRLWRLRRVSSLFARIYVAGLREEIVASSEQVLDLMEFGESFDLGISISLGMLCHTVIHFVNLQFAKMDGSRSLKFTFCSRFSTLVCHDIASRTLTLLSWVGAVISSWCNFITVLYVGHFLLEEDDKFLDKV